MEKKTVGKKWLSRLGVKYRLVLLDENTFEQITSFRLTRMGLYITLCSLFILGIIIISSLIIFTPIRYYIPGYGNIRERREYIRLNIQLDSLESVMQSRDLYMKDLHKVLTGNFHPSQMDTSLLKLPAVVNSTN